jgi:hypothetical protein
MFDAQSRMRSLPLLAVVLVVVAANAQTQSRSGPPDRSKTGAYALSYRDEVAHRKLLDSAHVSLHTAAFREALRNFAPGKAPELRMTWGEFITATGRVFVALQLAPPAEGSLRADAKVIAFGEVRNAASLVLYDFEEPSRIESSKNDVFIERTLLDDVRGATGTFGIARGGEILAVARTTFDFDAPDNTKPGISPLLVSNNVYNLPQMQKPFDPFAFGGTKVVPKPDHAFRIADEIWLFTELRNPALGSDKLPKLTATIDVEGNGKKMKGQSMPIDASPLKGVDNHFGLGTTVDLSHLPRGEYKVKLTVRDEISKEAFQREATIRLVE